MVQLMQLYWLLRLQGPGDVHAEGLILRPCWPMAALTLAMARSDAGQLKGFGAVGLPTEPELAISTPEASSIKHILFFPLFILAPAHWCVVFFFAPSKCQCPGKAPVAPP